MPNKDYDGGYYSLEVKLFRHAVYLFIGAVVISILLKLFVEWIEPYALKKVSFYPIKVVLWNLYGVLVSIIIDIPLFFVIMLLVPKKTEWIRYFVLGSLILISLFMLGVANVFIVLFCNLTDAVISFVCICTIFGICSNLRLALLIVYMYEIKNTPK